MSSIFIRIISIVLVLCTSSRLYAHCSCGGVATGAVTEAGLSGLLLEKKQWMFDISDEMRLFAPFNQLSANGNTEHQSLIVNENIRSVSGASVGLRYGLTGAITLSARQNALQLITDRSSRKLLGDASFLMSFRLFSRCNISAVGILGVEAPVGKKVMWNESILPFAGSGSWDPLGGLLVNYKMERSFFRLSGIYKYNTSGYDGYKTGSTAVQQLIYNYSLLQPRRMETDSVTIAKSFFTLDIQPLVYSEWQGTQLHNQMQVNSGSYTFAAGLNVVAGYGAFRILAGFMLPVYQQLHSAGAETRLTGRAALILVL